MEQYKSPQSRRSESGQSLVEYALIVTLAILAFGLALAATGPVVGNIFSNTVVNLVGSDPDLLAELPGREDFWLTVTWVATQTPQETPLATRTLAPPTQTPTAGPSPTFTPIIPTNTPPPTWTPTPSPTASDFIFPAPWTDTAEDASRINWRLDNSTFLGSEDWLGLYYPNRSLTGSPARIAYNGSLNPVFTQQLNFNWGSNAPISSDAQGTPIAFPNNDFGIVFRRMITVGDPGGANTNTTLRFSLSNLNDAARIWIVGGVYGGSANVLTGGPGSCSQAKRRDNISTNVTVGGTHYDAGSINNTGTGGNPYTTAVNRTNYGSDWQVYDDTAMALVPSHPFPSTECLLLDRWMNTSGGAYSFLRTVPAGTYMIQVDYADQTGDAAIRLDIINEAQRINADDTVVNNSGAPIAGGVTDCRWGNVSSNRADSPSFTWDESSNTSSEATQGRRCHLELRGAVEVPITMNNPALTFWDAWNLGAGSRAYLEVANYDPNNDGIFNRSELVWTSIPMHSASTFNYNWTYQTIDLNPFLQTGQSRRLTFRFVIERNANASSGRFRWYLDSMMVNDTPRQTFYTAQDWDLNSPSQTSDFITSGNWQLSNERTFGEGTAFHESVGRTSYSNYEDRVENNTISATGQFDLANMRAHSIEFNGFIDLDDTRGTTDSDGDQGDPLLSFFHSYQVGQYVGLEVQYTTDPYSPTSGDRNGANWITPSAWVILPVNRNTTASLTTMEKVTIPLTETGTVRRFRLRIVMLAHRLYSESNTLGWWLDNIRLERADRLRYTDLPFSDNAEETNSLLGNWSPSGSWGTVDGGNRPAEGTTGKAYTDSPSGNYLANSTATLELKYPIDLYLDTPTNPSSPDCNLPGGLCEAPLTRPVDPVMSFWHWRNFSNAVDLVVEWRRTTGTTTQTQWRRLWLYSDGMRIAQSNPANSTMNPIPANGDRVRVNTKWEKVYVDLRPIYEGLLADDTTIFTNTNKLDDDVRIRIRMQVNTTNRADGLYLDDIRIEERYEPVHALWTQNETRNSVAGTPYRNRLNTANTLGSGTDYFDGLDNTAWFNIWDVGGGWSDVAWERREGLLSFHVDSANPRLSTNLAPSLLNTISNPLDGNNGNTQLDSFNVLQMRTIIDLRGTLATDQPILYFWSRLWAGSQDFFQVQISEEITSAVNCLVGTTPVSPAVPQCYERDMGWGPWTTVWSRNNTRNYTWQREQVSLANYARTPSADGKRIRIRFIADALDGNNTSNRGDGWYIDNVQVTLFQPRTLVISKFAGGTSFSDGARNTQNWIREGNWGLTPALFRGSGGGPASLNSTWEYSVWNVSNSGSNRINPSCGSLAYNTCMSNFLNAIPLGATTPARWDTGIVTEIRENWGTSGPRRPDGERITDGFVYRWILRTPFLTAGRYTFITTSDDGVRLRYFKTDGTPLPPANSEDPPIYSAAVWNIVDNWRDQGRNVTVSSARIEASTQYTFVMEYYERNNDAQIQLSLGTFNFSFTAAQPVGSGRLQSEQRPAEAYSNSSLIFDGVFDLRQATNPLLQYWTYHELGGTAVVEISVDGGFTWTSDFLSGKPIQTTTLYPTGGSIFTSPWHGYYWNNYTGTGSMDFSAPGGWKNPTPSPSQLSVPWRPTGTPIRAAGASATTGITTFNGVNAYRNDGDQAGLNFNWGNNAPFSGVNADNFAVRWLRSIYIDPLQANTTYVFNTSTDDGVRLWLNYTPGCAWRNNSDIAGTYIFSGSPNNGQVNHRRGDDSVSWQRTSCLLIDDWEGQGPGANTVVRTLPAGNHILMLEVYDGGGGASVSFSMTQGSFSSPTVTDSTIMPDTANWQQRIHDLTAYAGPSSVPIMLRFRLNRLNKTDVNTSSNNANGATFNYPISWWITDILVNDP